MCAALASLQAALAFQAPSVLPMQQVGRERPRRPVLSTAYIVALLRCNSCLCMQDSDESCDVQKEGCRCHSALALRMQSEPVIARRSVIGMASASLLLAGGQDALAKDAPKGKPVFVEQGLSYIVKKEPDGGPLAKLALAVSPGEAGAGTCVGSGPCEMTGEIMVVLTMDWSWPVQETSLSSITSHTSG